MNNFFSRKVFETRKQDLKLIEISDWIDSIWHRISGFGEALIHTFFEEITEQVSLETASIIFQKYNVDDLKYWIPIRPRYELGVNTKQFIDDFDNMKMLVEQSLLTILKG